MKDQNSKIALVTGSNRGIGKEISKQLAMAGIKVIMSARDKQKGEETALSLKNQGLEVDFIPLDVKDAASIQKLPEELKNRGLKIDILINNAAILLDRTTRIDELSLEDLENTMATNVYGPFLLTQTLLPQMKKQNYGRVVNVSSGMGSISDMSDVKSPVSTYSSPAYRLSKAALNVLTILFAKEASQHNILVNSMCPGWVRTEMGGSNAPLSVEQGAETAIWLATLPENGPTGGFFRNKKLIPW